MNDRKLDPAWWASECSDLMAALATSPDGLAADDAAARARISPASGPSHPAIRLFAAQFATPLVLILVIAASLSLLLREWLDAAIILLIVFGSGVLGFTQEYAASRAVAELQSRLVRRVRVLRAGTERELPLDEVVPGDVALLKTGDIVPGDGRLLQSDSLLVDEAVLTGEPFPVEKHPSISPPEAALPKRFGALFEGTSVRSGTARMLVVVTGAGTQFGAIRSGLEKAEQQTEFARGLAAFGKMLMRVMLLIVALVLLASLALGREMMTSVLFAMALAVAISPQLLPVIVSATLAAGARRMAGHGVLVRRLEAIENLGGMDILCTDKTGTLTKGAIALSAAVDADGKLSREVMQLAAFNAKMQSAMASALDEAILSAALAGNLDLQQIEKLAEEPYDFTTRRYGVEVRPGGASPMWITKGAVKEVLAGCTRVRSGDTEGPLDRAATARIHAFVEKKAGEGFRLLGVSTGAHGDACFAGFLLFFDPPKPQIGRVVASLGRAAISVRIVSGDNRHVCAYMARTIGLPAGELLTGEEIATLGEQELSERAARTTIFAEIEPQQKERIVRAFQQAGHAVGYMGDGINDAPALRAADIGISVDTAVDVARESADIVLLRPDLNAIRRGVEDGRRTFTNTLKYIAITISANFGNMVSMALATVLLPFLPLLPVQILLNNFLSDLPAVAIAGDAVDPEHFSRAQRWDIRRIRNFMILFGLISTAFDLATFALLRLLLHADAAHFRTSWFVVSLLTELAALLVLRTRRAFWKSVPAPLLMWGSVFVAIVALALPYSGPVAAIFSFEPIPAAVMGGLLMLVVLYAAVTETVKRRYHLQAT